MRMASKDQDLRKKRDEISHWLSHIFGPDSVPDFELNAQTIQILHQLSVTTQFNEKNTHFYINDLKKKTEEYNADAQRVRSILSKLNLDQNNFPKPCASRIQALAQTGAVIGVKDASETSYMLSCQELLCDLNDLTVKLQSENQEVQKLSIKTQDILMKHNVLQKALEAVEVKSTKETSKISERKKETDMLRKTTERNEQEISKLKVKLANTGVTESDFHERLVKKREKLESLENELAPLKTELQSFASLPPDAVETKVKIEQLKRELTQLQARMTECVDVTLDSVF